MKRSRNGYTLTEVMIVLTIIGVLASLALPILAGHVSRSYNSEALQQIAQIRGALSEYRSVNGTYERATFTQGTPDSLSYNPVATGGQVSNWVYTLDNLDVNTYTVIATRNGAPLPNPGCQITMTEAGVRGPAANANPPPCPG